MTQDRYENMAEEEMDQFNVYMGVYTANAKAGLLGLNPDSKCLFYVDVEGFIKIKEAGK